MPTHAAPSRQRTREAYFALIRPQLPGLYEFVRRQLFYFEDIGDLVPGELTVEDVVDAALLRAYREFVAYPSRRKVGRWLMTMDRKYLEAEAKRLKARRARTVSLEGDVTEIPPEEEVSTLGR